MRLATTLATIALLAACATSEPDPPSTANLASGSAPAEAPITNNAGAKIGVVTFTPAPQGILMRIMVEPGGLSAGWHGVHIHMVGDCSDTAKFEHAGGHVQKTATSHGLLYAHGPDNGDLPNISVAGDGSSSVELFSQLVTLSDLQDADGSALIIHANADDHISQPIGNAGDRLACAVVPR